MPTCIKWGEERHQECTQTADQGYNECTRTRDDGYRDCCDWWPCSWFCDAWVWISNVVCVAWTWVSNVVCVAWTWITTAVCVLWDVVTTIVNVIWGTIESILGWVLSALAFIIELLEMIPVIGTLIRWIINAITLVIQVLSSIPDAFLGLIGIRPEKKLRVCTVILKDENGNAIATPEEVVPLLQLAADIYKRDANVRLIPSKPFKYNTGFAGADRVDTSWIVSDGSNSDADTLDVPCDASNEWLLGGTKFQLKSSTLCFFGNWRRVLGFGAPITCFIIRNVTGNAIGCSLLITDYVTVDREAVDTSPRTIGHEIGHSSMLWHLCVDDDIANMMATSGDCNPASALGPDRVNPTINNWQAILIRTSKHVSYF
jgi:hypothetical protein